MISRVIHIEHKQVILACISFIISIVAAMLFAQTALAAFSFSSNVVGIGNIQSTAAVSSTVTPEQKISIALPDSAATTDVLVAPAERVVTVLQDEDGNDGTEDYSNENGNGVTSVLVTGGTYVSAAGISINVSGEWDGALASTYGFGDEMGQETAWSGTGPVTETSMGIALPLEIARKLIPYGSQFELSYNGNTCIVTVVDCGGFAKYGRAFDLQPAVARALGFSGVGTVNYRYLG
ncbi:MAG: hypothetical protein HGA54_06590 [Actinobacteria bacterium]|nr:hypothetical protein [Actinomycetota bacterium]